MQPNGSSSPHCSSGKRTTRMPHPQSMAPAIQISNKSCFPEIERFRRSPSVPRGAPQCRHFIGVDDGAFSGQSKTMPSPSQSLQTTSKLAWSGICATSDAFEFIIAFLETKPQNASDQCAVTLSLRRFSDRAANASSTAFRSRITSAYWRDNGSSTAVPVASSWLGD
jgi:hypothetical protein